MFQTGPVLGESIKGQASRTPGGGGGHSWDNQGHQGRHQGPWGGVQRMRGWCPCGPRAALLRPRPALRPRQCLALAPSQAALRSRGCPGQGSVSRDCQRFLPPSSSSSSRTSKKFKEFPSPAPVKATLRKREAGREALWGPSCWDAWSGLEARGFTA